MVVQQQRLSRKQKRQHQRESSGKVQIVDRHPLSIKTVTPLTTTQDEFVDAYYSGLNIVATGCAGTGKTYLAMFLAVKDLLENELYDTIIIVRSAVQTRSQGFVPGHQSEKDAIYEQPYYDIISDLFECSDAYRTLKATGKIKFITTANIRGLTWDNCVIIADESQNMNYEELRAIVTRAGNNCRIIFCGDTKQSDLYRSKYDVSGFGQFVDIIKQMRSFGVVTFTVADIVRSGLVREFIETEQRVVAE